MPLPDQNFSPPSNDESQPTGLEFLAGGGKMDALMRSHDWASTPLGPVETWSQSLRTVVVLALNARQPMFIAWGPQLAFLYNDDYAPIFGDKHPRALGRPFAEVWADIWEQISPLVERTLAGEASFHEDLLVPMDRHGYHEEAWFSFSYTPVRDETGEVAGMFCAAIETTQMVRARREAVAVRERQQRMLHQMPGFAGILVGPEHRYEYVNDAYIEISGPRDFLGRTVREVFPELEGQGFYELLDSVYASGKPFCRTRHADPTQPGRRRGTLHGRAGACSSGRIPASTFCSRTSCCRAA